MQSALRRNRKSSYYVRGGSTHHGEVLTSGCDIDHASFDEPVMNCFLHLNLTKLVQAVCEGAGKSDGHVLHHQHSDSEISREQWQDLLESLRASRRCTKGNHRRLHQRG